MTRALTAAALLAGLALTGCATWEDRANAEALAKCEDKVDTEDRRLCRDMVIAAAKGEHQKQIDALQSDIDKAEQRELNRKVYGGPGQVDD